MNLKETVNMHIPEIEFAEKLYRPHCGHLIFSYDDSLVSKRPHLIFAYGWNDSDLFLAVRYDYANSFMKAQLQSKTYQECLAENEMEPIAKQVLNAFCISEFKPEDRIASHVSAYCNNLQ